MANDRRNLKNRKNVGRSRGGSANFWNREYKTGEHIVLSTEPSEDLAKFCRWQERQYGREFLNPLARVLDLGCGNGRNVVFLAREYGMSGTGYDISEEAILQAEELAADLPEGSGGPSLEFSVRSIAVPLPVADASATLVLDMMSSHFLRNAERCQLRDEILRVLKPGGWLFFKSFLLEGDLNAKRMLADYPDPSGEPNAYIHPKFGAYEYVWTEASLRAFFEPSFEIHKLEKSHKHMLRGKPFKRRTVSAYLQKK